MRYDQIGLQVLAGLDSKHTTTGSLSSTADQRFAAQMIPHHESAVAMASEILQRGQDPEMLALAQNIIKSQQTEVIQLRQFLARQGKPYVITPPGRFDNVAAVLGLSAIALSTQVSGTAQGALSMGGSMLVGTALHSYLMKLFGHL